MKQFGRGWPLLIFILLLVSLACNLTLPGVPAFFATPTPTPLPLPPTIVETVPQIGSELPLQAPLLIYFSEPMDRGSVQAGLSADMPGGFLFDWMDDSTLSLTPKSVLPTETSINFTLAASARAANGLTLLQPITFSYLTAGPLRVAQVLPGPQAKDVSPDSAVVVSFNQPVVALGASTGSGAGLPVGFSLEPATAGKGEWLNTSTYIFHADPVLAGGTDYTVRVNPQLAGTSGGRLAATDPNQAWTFRTSLPALEQVTPKTSDGALSLDPQFQLAFNQPMQRASVEAGLSLTGPQGKVPGTFTWNDNSSVVTYQPASLLERASTYVLNLSGQSRARVGATLGSDTSLTYQTVPAFGILATPFANGATRPSSTNLRFTFTAPLGTYSKNELATLISASPALDYEAVFGGGPEVTVDGFLVPGKTYTLTFSGKLVDRWGQALGKDFTFSFREPDATPSVQLAPYLPALFVSPSQPVADVQVVNVHVLKISRGSLPLADFFRYQGDYNFQQGYVPADLQSWTNNPGIAPNQNERYGVNFSQDGQPLAPGLYFVNVTSDEAPSPGSTAKAMLVSNINVTLKTSASGVLVWAMDQRTQTPAAGVPVLLFDDKGNSLVSGTTDANGLWQGRLPTNAARLPALGKMVAAAANALPEGSAGASGTIYAVLGQPGDDLFGMAASSWNQEISPWNFGLTADNTSSPSTRNIYLYTDRPVYRPGDTVYYRGVIHTLYNGRYSNAGLAKVSATLNGSGVKLAEANLDVSAYGSFHGEFSLPAGGIPGYYSIDISTGDSNSNGGDISFQVADYRKPEINLSVVLNPSPALSGQALTGKISASYFFGAPVADLPFTWSLYSSPTSFAIPEFQTGLYQSAWMEGGSGAFGETLASGSGRTGPDGSFVLPLNSIQVNDTTQLTLEITATETGGSPVSARDTLTMHPAKFYAGVRPNTWFGQAGTSMGFDILTVGWDQAAAANENLTASFQKVTWERSDLPYSYEFTPSYTTVASKQLITDAGGQAQVSFTPAEAGTYILDVSGQGARSQVLIWVGGAQNAAWPNLPYQHIELTADELKYKPGDTAAVFIPNPLGLPAPALITTERSTILSAQVVSIPPGGYTYSLPLSDEHAPNTYVSVTLLGAQGDFRQGYVDLQVEPASFTLNVNLKATPEKAHPGDQITLDLSVTDAKGQPVQAEFSLAAVDLAVLALANPNSQDIVPAYYSVQSLGVQTSLSAAVYAGRVFVTPGGLGGGGAGDQTLTIREKFPDTAYWKADIVTDVQGQAQVTFTLPDSLTTWQIDSRGLTQDVRVGQARVKVVTSKELLIRPQTPSFLVVGDQAELVAIVNNTTSSALDGTASLQADGFNLDNPATAIQEIHVPANGRVSVAWSGLAQAGNSIDPIFSVKAGSFQDASRALDGPIPVLHYTAPQTFSTAGVLSGAATRQEIIALPKTFQPLGGKLDLELSPSLAASVLSTLQERKSSLETISWSNELIVSDFLPDLATYQVLKDAGLSDTNLSTALGTTVKDDVRRLLANQNPTDGGWSWVTGSDLESDPYLSAYTLFALGQANKAGLGIDVSGALQRGHDYLMAAPPLDGKSDLSLPWALNRAVFQEYVLAQTGGANLNYLDSLYAGRNQLDPWAKALLAQTLSWISPTDARAGELFSNVESGAIRSATGEHWESVSGDQHNPGSPLFTTAIAVYSLSQRTPVDPALADAVRYLVAQRGAAGRWGSPYEEAWIILALDQYMHATSELQANFSYSAALNGGSLAQGQAAGLGNLSGLAVTAPLTQLNLGGANSLLVSRAAGPGELYYRAALTVDRPVETAPALEQGLAVSREFLSCPASNDCRQVTSYQMSSDTSGRVAVRLTVTLPKDAYYLLVQDNIPAGAQILDSSLKTSQQGQQDQAVQALPYDAADPFSQGWGWWYFNPPQIYSDHILWSADYLPAGTYVLTYTIIPSLPGRYRVLPAHAWQAYFPEVQGTSAGALFEIKAP